MSLADRVVLVTGATGGLGRIVVPAVAAAGARLGLVGTDQGRLAALASDAGLADGRWVTAGGDLRDPVEARRAVEEVVGRFGGVDVVLHLVGGWLGGTPVVELDHDELRSMLDQHLWTTLHVLQAVVPGMVERGWGRILAVSSPNALDPAKKMASYAVGKAAEEVLLRTLAREVAGSGVTINVVVVRAIDTGHERESAPSVKNAGWTTPEEIASVLLFLCSDEAAAITGARIPLDGRA